MILEIKGETDKNPKFYMKRDPDGDIEVGVEKEGKVYPLVYFSANGHNKIKLNRYHVDSLGFGDPTDIKSFVEFDERGLVKTND